MEKVTLKNWQLEYGGKTIPATVPGDITIDLYNAGIVKNPYFGDNQKENDWIPRQDFTYVTEIDADEEILSQESVQIVFEGVDVYSEIFLNGKQIGSTDNMFLQFRFDVKEFLKKGKNELRVEMKSTLNKMDTFDTSGYFSIFNEKRLFVRKAQCHFGWDWAPKICAYGIWQDVYLFAEYLEKDELQTVVYSPKLWDNVRFTSDYDVAIEKNQRLFGKGYHQSARICKIGVYFHGR